MLRINYGTVPFDSEEPEILTDGNWRKLYNSHFIDKIYNYWLNNLLLPNRKKLFEIAPKGDWQETQRITQLFSIICKYDQDSSFFRYPITKNTSHDHEKNTIKKIKFDTLKELTQELDKHYKTNKATFTMLLADENDNISSAFIYNENILHNVRDALREVAHYFHCIHIMTRLTLCKGM